MTEQTREQITLANVNVTGALQFQQKLMRGVGIAMMVLGGLMSLTIIGAVIGIPLIIMGLAVYFLLPKFFGGMHKAMMPPPNPPPQA